MKKILTSFITINLFIIYIIAQENKTINNLIKYFDQIYLPFTSDQIDFTYKELPFELSLKYFFKGDTLASYYYEKIYNQEDNTIISSNLEKKIIIPKNFYYYKNKLFLIYKLINENEDPYTFLCISENGIQKDSLVISYETTSAPDLYKWIRSKIFEDSIIIFEYKQIPAKKRDNIDIATNITINFFKVDLNNNKFVLIKKEFINNKYELYQLNYPTNKEIKDSDPFYKY